MPFPFSSGSAQGTNTNTTDPTREPTSFVPRWCDVVICWWRWWVVHPAALHQTGNPSDPITSRHIASHHTVLGPLQVLL